MSTKKFWRRFRTDEDLQAELRAHQEMHAEDARGAGITEAEAKRQARLQLGAVRSVIERMRDQELSTALESVWRDFLIGLRNLRKSPLFSITAILTIAFGIGANAAIFSLLYGLVLKSLSVDHPEQLMHVGVIDRLATDKNANSRLPYAMLDEYRRRQHSFTDLAAWFFAGLSIEQRDGSVRMVMTGMAEGNGFPLLGAKPYLGRLIYPADDVRGGPVGGWPVVLSFRFWNERFAADPRVIGKKMQVANLPVTVVGVLGSEFHGVWPGANINLYLPMRFIEALEEGYSINSINPPFLCSAIGRLRPGISTDQARAEASLHWLHLAKNFLPAEEDKDALNSRMSLQISSAKNGLPTYFSYVYVHPLRLMQGLVLAVLVLCCSNVAGLMMSKVYLRQREFAVRTALGAARWRLVRQYLTESLIISLVGALLGGAAAWYVSKSLLSFFRDPMMGEPIAVHPDANVFWMTGLCAIAATFLFGALPALRAGKANPGSLLKSRTASGGRSFIAGRAFIPLQVALSMVLVTLAAMLSQSLSKIRSEKTGFELNHVTIQATHFDRAPQHGNRKLDLYQRMVDRLNQMPGMRSAAVTWMTPMTGFQETTSFSAVDGDHVEHTHDHLPYNIVGPGYFRTMETPIVEGREFRKNERQPDVCILNRAASESFFSRSQALGATIRSTVQKKFNGIISCHVIGIAENAKFARLREVAPPTIFFPLSLKALQDEPVLVFLMNSDTKAQAVSGYRKMMAEIAPAMPLNIFVTLKEQQDAALGSEYLITKMCSLFAILALFLSALGLYGLLSSSVAQRTNEIGIRLALGAQRRTVLRMILREALRLLGVGVLLGSIALLLALQVVQKMLYRVSAFDPATLALVLAVLTMVTLIAAYVPAMRASSVDPMEALRAE